MLITFSGLDGAGKSTLIARLRSYFEARGRPVVVLTMYDDLTCFSHLRAARDAVKQFGRRVLGRPEPPPPVLTLDERGHAVGATSRGARIVYQATRNVTLRQVACLIDLVIASLRLRRHARDPNCVVLLDRYFYDSMVDIAGASRRCWFYSVREAANLRPRRLRYVRCLIALARKPDAAVLVDVPPEVAFDRKPEYPVAYLAARRVVYRRLFTDFVDRAAVLDNQDGSAAFERLLAIVAGGHGTRRVA